MKQPTKKSVTSNSNVTLPDVTIGEVYVNKIDKVTFEVLNVTSVTPDSIRCNKLIVTPQNITTLHEINVSKSKFNSYRILKQNAYDKMLKLYNMFYVTSLSIINNLFESKSDSI